MKSKLPDLASTNFLLRSSSTYQAYRAWIKKNYKDMFSYLEINLMVIITFVLSLIAIISKSRSLKSKKFLFLENRQTDE